MYFFLQKLLYIVSLRNIVQISSSQLYCWKFAQNTFNPFATSGSASVAGFRSVWKTTFGSLTKTGFSYPEAGETHQIIHKYENVHYFMAEPFRSLSIL